MSRWVFLEPERGLDEGQLVRLLEKTVGEILEKPVSTVKKHGNGYEIGVPVDCGTILPGKSVSLKVGGFDEEGWLGVCLERVAGNGQEYLNSLSPEMPVSEFLSQVSKGVTGRYG